MPVFNYYAEIDNTSSASEMNSIRLQLFLKRLLDVIISLLALIVLIPLLIGIALAICIEDRGPPLFSQIRWGRNDTKIRVFKFRSMSCELGDPTGVKQTVADDPRVTRVGRLLRKTNLDELPQLWNVLKGDMSLVGPRCHAVGMLAAGLRYEELVPRYHERHSVRPGLTGLAQMRGLRGPTERPSKARARIHADLFYVKNFSLGLDARIIVGTVLSELRGGSGS
ncbi:sugar transferase [Rhizobium sp. B230/85]|nr:sugar transferase [Rhizobium sp. B209b/85]MBO9186799.1 sugar transferase [Rhizobium sp. E27B/91]QXZ99090.1 sugar transferase [Rhizobium sp. B230/85]